MSFRRARAFAEAGIPIFPVRLERRGGRWSKKPLVLDWARCATTDPEIIAGWWLRWPLAAPGIPLGRCGLVVVDADRHPGKADGVAALAGISGVPPHPVVKTAGGGEHHYFRQPNPPIADNRAFSGEGIDVLGSSRFVVGYAVEPLLAWVPELPEVFGERMEKRYRRIVKFNNDVSVRVEDVSSALMQLDPQDFVKGVDGAETRARWLALMNGAKAAGVPLEVFCEWSARQDHYARDDDEIEKNWHSLRATHRGAFFAELKAAGIRLPTHNHIDRFKDPAVPIQQTRTFIQQTRNFNNRANSLYDWLNKNPSEPNLFKVSCIFGEMIAEKLLTQSIATKLLSNNCWQLRKQMGADQFRETISRAFRHVEEKLLEVGSGNANPNHMED
jgi:hypothetical protein